MDILGIAAIPAITVICFLIAEAIKATALDNKWLPVICGALGGILGVVALYISPEIIPSTDVLTSIAIGIVSGLAATGAHQVYKQLTNDGEVVAHCNIEENAQLIAAILDADFENKAFTDYDGAHLDK